MKYYLLSSSPELALDVGLNLVRGETDLVLENVFKCPPIEQIRIIENATVEPIKKKSQLF